MVPALLLYIVGGSIAIIGLVLFVIKGTQGGGVIKIFNLEFRVIGSSLIIFIVGISIFLIPVLIPIIIHPPNNQDPLIIKKIPIDQGRGPGASEHPEH
jgi:energy-converting hydrogenase Eha subunit E